jgi:DNA-binding response OmpR family regulator
MLPGLDGLSVLRHIRLEDERLPVLILSAKGAPDDRVKGFTYGVDDYLSKPFSLEEFLLRVERLLTRTSWSRPPSPAGELADPQVTNKYAFGGNTTRFFHHEAECRQGTIQLTEQEARLLKVSSPTGKTSVAKVLLQVDGLPGVTTTPHGGQLHRPPEKVFLRTIQNPVYFRSLRSVGYLFDHP